MDRLVNSMQAHKSLAGIEVNGERLSAERDSG
jgi:hypothetical protein